MNKTFFVEADETGMRLDKFVVGKMDGVSRAKIQREIEEGHWLVDGTKVTPHYALKEGQTVTRQKLTKTPEKKTGAAILRKAKVIAETDDYLIVNKPSGIAVHPADGLKELTLVDFLLKKYPDLRAVGEDALRPGVVHRLDKQISGVMVVARTQRAWQWLKKSFQERAVVKEYSALVHGTFVNDEGIIELPLVRSKTRRHRGTMKALPHGASDVAGARDAVTAYAVRRRFPRFTLLAAYPKTGRTHQIRAHFAAIGHPIVGDIMYPGKRSREWHLAPLGRPFLHASRIAFVDMSGIQREYSVPLPKELAGVLEELV